MTLPQAMVGLFPEEGGATAIDTKSGAEYELTFRAPRTVLGLGELFGANKLAVNDELHVRALEDGKFAITPVARPRTPDYTTEENLAALLDDLLDSSVRMTEQEIRAVYEVPQDVDIAGALRDDDRFAFLEGRWVNAATVLAEETEPEPEQVVVVHDDARLTGSDDVVEEKGDAVAVAAPIQEPRQEQRAPSLSASSENGAQAMFAGAQGGGSQAPQASQAGAPGLPEQAGLWTQPNEPARLRTDYSEAQHVVERRASNSQVEFEDDDAEDEGSAGEATMLASRFRRIMLPVGFRIEPVGKGQVRLVAAMGRRSYKVLVQLLSHSERLDWAELLAKRRGNDFRHLAVVGEHHDLLRLTGPAELARATLWSWQGLDRLASLHKTVPISPMDLEPHFERDGLFEHGLQRFEATIAARVAERGELSEVLARLNQLRAPTVFLLEDLVVETNMPRDRALGVLERLSAAPFHLVARVDHGEFVLRQHVESALTVLSSYALALKDQLPSRQVEKLTGLGEPELLVGTSEDDLQTDDELTSEGGISA